MKKVSISLYFDKRRQKENGLYPIKIRITYQRQSRYYPTGYDLSEDEFIKQRDCEMLKASKQISLKEYSKLVKIHKGLNTLLTTAEEIISSLKTFNFTLFERRKNEVINYDNDIFMAYDEIIKELEENDRIGTSITYKCSLSSLKKFYTKKKLYIEDVTVLFLKKYELWMLDDCKNSITTVGFYLRCLRAVFNRIIDNDLRKVDEYPFSSKKYIIPTQNNAKRALEIDELKKIFEYKAENGTSEERYLDYWKFMYMSNGMNLADMAKLKYSDISNDELKFIRKKTVTTKRNVKEISAYYGDESREIVKKWGNKPALSENYIFTIYSIGLSEKEKKKARANTIKLINKYLLQIAQKIGIDGKITTYTARHSFFSKFYNETNSLTETKELAGHTSIITTEKYVKSFKQEKTKEVLKNITKF